MKQPIYYAEKYKEMYMQMAITAASASVANRRKVGCLLYLNDHSLCISWNGKPPASECEICEDEHNTTLPDVIHAEANCINRLKDAQTDHLTLGAIAFVTMSCCVNCAKLLINHGIQRVYYLEEYRDTSGLDLLRQNNIETIQLKLEGL